VITKGYEGPDWTKINDLVFIELLLHYGQQFLDFGKDKSITKLGQTKIKSEVLFLHHNQKNCIEKEEWKVGSDRPRQSHD